MNNCRATGGLRCYVMRAVMWLSLVLGSADLLALSTSAQAIDCATLGGSINGGVCETSAQVTVSGTLTFNETLHLLPGAKIIVPQAESLTPGTALTLNIVGDFIMDTGSQIVGDASGASVSGAQIAIVATGNVVLHGSGVQGARITVNQKGSCANGGTAGSVSLSAPNGSITTEEGSLIAADARCSGGEIVIKAGLVVDIAGQVSSYGKATGAGAVRRPGGGPISVMAGCELIVEDSGVISSRGKDPGADLVHLEGGCLVEIRGLVESTGPGHGAPNSPPNRCNNTFRPDKPSNSVACVEVWSGGLLLIDNRNPHHGEVNADTAQSGGSSGLGWIDLFAAGRVEVLAASSGKFAIHANGLLPNATGGMITVKSIADVVAASGQALQADAVKSGGAGGDITVESKSHESFMSTNVSAQGDSVSAGGLGIGGIVSLRSFDGETRWVLGDGNVQPAATGILDLIACQGVVTAGTNFHGVTPSQILNLCDGTSPTLPPYVVLPQCVCKKK